MARTQLGVGLVTLALLSIGCDVLPVQAPAQSFCSASLSPEAFEPADPFKVRPGEARHLILESPDGESQEEVIYLDADPETVNENNNFQVPELISETLAAAPGGLDDEPPAAVEMIVESDDGAVQEEVVYLDSDLPIEESLSAASAISTGDLLASL